MFMTWGGVQDLKFLAFIEEEEEEKEKEEQKQEEQEEKEEQESPLRHQCDVCRHKPALALQKRHCKKKSSKKEVSYKKFRMLVQHSSLFLCLFLVGQTCSLRLTCDTRQLRKSCHNREHEPSNEILRQLIQLVHINITNNHEQCSLNIFQITI